MFWGRKHTFRSRYGISKNTLWEIEAPLSLRQVYEAVSLKTNQTFTTKTIFCTLFTRDSKKLKKIWEHKRCRDVIWLKASYFEGCVFMAKLVKRDNIIHCFSLSERSERRKT